MPTVKRAPRVAAKEGQRDYGKEDLPPTFDIAGFRG
jgi:hypothetical protein